jgi:hypothetical protein
MPISESLACNFLFVSLSRELNRLEWDGEAVYWSASVSRFDKDVRDGTVIKCFIFDLQAHHDAEFVLRPFASKVKFLVEQVY